MSKGQKKGSKKQRLQGRRCRRYGLVMCASPGAWSGATE
jgi:hypothetical protein